MTLQSLLHRILRNTQRRRRLIAAKQSSTAEHLEERLVLSGTGLQGHYFNSNDLSGAPALVRTDANLDFDWGAGSPDAAVSADNFSVRWAGEVEANFTEMHSFWVNANDGVRLWVNGQLLIDEFDANTVNAMADIDLIAGRRYDIQLEYREVTGNASVSLEWESASRSRQVIPQAQLFAAERGSLSAARFDGVAGGTVNSLTADADFPNNPDTVSPVATFAAVSNAGDSIGQRLHGQLHAPETGAYMFYIAADNQAELWLSNTADRAERAKIAEVTSPVAAQDFTANAQQQSAAVQLVAGQTYYIEALHADDSGADHLAVAWQTPGSASIEVIDGQHLSPDLPTVQVFATNPSVSEGAPAPAQLSVQRSGPTNEALTVQYDVSGSAINGTDYQTLDGTIVIPAGQASVVLNITPLSDSLNESDETLIVTLRDATGYDLGFKSERTAHVTLQDDRDVQAGGQTLFSGTTLSDFSHFGGAYTTQNVAGVGDVIQAAITGAPASQFSAQLRQSIDSPVGAGDVLYAEFLVRSIGGPGQISVIFEDASTFSKSLTQGLDVTTDWQRVQLPFVAAEDHAVGDANFGFHLGFQTQTLQFADIQLLTFGPQKTLAPETDFGLNNLGGGTWGTAETVMISGQPFDFAYQVETHTVPTQTWHLQATERNEAPVSNGDAMRLTFHARATAGANPQARLVVARVNDSYSTLHGENIPLTASWQQYTIDVVADTDFAANFLQVAFNLGYGLQTVEIGGFHWENLANAANLDDLPKQVPAVSYGGRSGVDTWRMDADARIEAFRKSAVTIHVTDNADQPIDGAVVSLRQNKHAFRFGSAINNFGGQLAPDANETALKYQSEIKRLFNTVVAENSHKWPQWINDRGRALQLTDFAEDNDLFLRGHVVIWPSRDNMPDVIWTEYDIRVTSDGLTSANLWLRTTIETHFDDIINTYRGRITEWDVVNEPWTNHDVMDILGDDIVIDWYQRFRTADPNVDLALNDFLIFANNGKNTSHRANFDGWLTQLRDADLLDVIGEQSHYGETNLTDIDILGQLITDYHTNFSADVAITEFDITTDDEQLAADYLRDYLTMAFSQSGVTEFLHWGFWEGAHFSPEAALYRTDFSIKPSGQVWEDAVFGNWWTDTTGTTRGGNVATDAFLGEYDVIVQYQGNTYNGTVAVDASGNSSITVVLEDIGTPVLTLDIQDSVINERDGASATTATITRTGDKSAALDVTLNNSDPGEAAAPATITIPAGAASATFPIDAVDDGIIDRAQTVTFTATAANFIDTTAELVVEDLLNHRMSNLTVIVQDQNGNPLPNATVDVSMTRHDFTFGTQVRHRLFGVTQPEFDALNDSQKAGLLESGSGSGLVPTWTDLLNYRTAVYTHFNHIVPTNGMQWVAYNNAGPTHVDTAINLAQAEGFTVTGHAAVWGKDGWPTPNEYRIAASPDSQTFLDALIADRLSGSGVMARYSDTGAGPTITDWDVLNEPLHEHYFANTFVNAGFYANSTEFYADVFRRAHAVRPDARLAVNDYNIITSNSDNAARQYRDFVNDVNAELASEAASIEVIKVQAHTWLALSKADITRRLDILAETGLPIVISEFDMRDDAGQLNAAQQEQTFRNFLEASFEHPAVEAFTMWGFWDPGHWRGNGPLYNTDWSFKAEAAPWTDLVEGAWISSLIDQAVDSSGRWINDAALFDGIYDITATSGGVSASLNDFTLNADGEVVLTIDVPAADLAATQFNAVSDHVLNGQTDVEFTVHNASATPAGPFETYVVWSPNNVIGDADDVVVAGSVSAFTGLGAGASETKTISLQLDRAALYAHAAAADPAGQPVGTVSSDSSRLFLIVDVNNSVVESNEANNSGQGHLVDSDDIAYFPWDTNGNGTVTPIEALQAIQAINTPDAVHDFDGNGIVTPLEAVAVLQRIGYVRETGVLQGWEASANIAGPAILAQSVPEVPTASILAPPEAATVVTAVLVSSKAAADSDLFPDVVDELPATPPLAPAEVDVFFETSTGWLELTAL